MFFWFWLFFFGGGTGTHIPFVRQNVPTSFHFSVLYSEIQDVPSAIPNTSLKIGKATIPEGTKIGDIKYSNKLYLNYGLLFLFHDEI